MAKRYVSYGDVGTKLQNPRPDILDNFNPSVPGKTSVQELEKDLPQPHSNPGQYETSSKEIIEHVPTDHILKNYNICQIMIYHVDKLHLTVNHVLYAEKY